MYKDAGNEVSRTAARENIYKGVKSVSTISNSKSEPPNDADEG